MTARLDPSYGISSLCGGALVVLAIFISCFLSWKLMDSLRSGGKSDGRTVNAGHVEARGRHIKPPPVPTDSLDDAIVGPMDCSYWSEWGGLGGMTRREQEEFFAHYGPRKVRKAMKESLRARQQLPH